MSAILTIRGLSKSYGQVKALKGITFDVPEGSIFGLLGPNGSGKTTLLGIILEVLKPDQGTFEWFNGVPHAEARKQIGSLLETPNFYHYLTAGKNLEINALIKGCSTDDIDRVLDTVKLLSRKNSKFSTYSLGMKQRLAIANALLGNPKILLLDEPTNGLDPEGIAEIRELIVELHHKGITIIMASHLLDEVEKVCTDVSILKQGEVLAYGNVEDIFNKDNRVEVSADNLTLLKTALEQLKGVRIISHNQNAIQISLPEDLTPAEINKICYEQGIILSQLQVKRKSLEAHFMELTR